MKWAICCSNLVVKTLVRGTLRYYSKQAKNHDPVRIGQTLVPAKYQKKLREKALQIVRVKMAQGDAKLEEALAPLQAAVKEQVRSCLICYVLFCVDAD